MEMRIFPHSTGIPFLCPSLQKAPKKHGWVLSAALLLSPARGCLLTPHEPAPGVTRSPRIQEPIERPQPPPTHMLSPHTHCSHPSSPLPLSQPLTFHASSAPHTHPWPISHLKPRCSQSQPQTRQCLPALCPSDLTHFVVPHPTRCCLHSNGPGLTFPCTPAFCLLPARHPYSCCH